MKVLELTGSNDEPRVFY